LWDSISAVDDTENFQAALDKATGQPYVLRLYVSGSTPQSLRAVSRIKKVCEDHLKGCYQLEVVDVYKDPRLSEADDVIAAPTLIRISPLPVRRLVGDMSDTSRVLNRLDLPADKEAS